MASPSLQRASSMLLEAFAAIRFERGSLCFQSWLLLIQYKSAFIRFLVYWLPTTTKGKKSNLELLLLCCVIAPSFLPGCRGRNSSFCLQRPGGKVEPIQASSFGAVQYCMGRELLLPWAEEREKHGWWKPQLQHLPGAPSVPVSVSWQFPAAILGTSSGETLGGRAWVCLGIMLLYNDIANHIPVP